MSPFLDTLGEYGAHRESVRLFDQDGPDLLPYATLMRAHRGGTSAHDADFDPLAGVYEWQGAPLMFLVDGDAMLDEDHFRRLRRKLALHGDAPYLGLVQPGTLTVHSLSLDRLGPQDSRVPPEVLGPVRGVTLARLASMRPGGDHGQGAWIADVVLTLLGAAIRTLHRSRVDGEEVVSIEDAVSIAGRALFVRFLGDRNLLPPSVLPPGANPSLMFGTRAAAETTSTWLDKTFNGDLLPVASRAFASLDDSAFGTLTDIMRRAPGSQLYLGWEQKWDYLDFAHIPVGVFSQAYEQFMREHHPEKQRKEGGFYTPRVIADLVVKVAFQPLHREEKAHLAKVLDPAAGAGVFLLASFRHLVSLRWEHDKVQPNTDMLREILYNQIVGFDVNEEALRFAALGLYLMAIELDPDPEPVTKLIFRERLRDRVLFKLAPEKKGKQEKPAARPLGSLGDVSSVHVGEYDIVVGNPPWTTSTKLPDWSKVKETVTRIAVARLGVEKVPESLLPNECLDLPFVWRALEWARPGGRIAFALHARLLFQQGDGMPEARRTLFQALDVTGVINGAELRKTHVWPQITAPFCLLFGRNQVPTLGSALRFVSPHLEKALNGAGVLRVDAGSAELVTVQELVSRPELFKILFRGTRLDLEVLERVVAVKSEALDAYWAGLFKGKPRQTGNGYQRLRPSSRPRKTNGDGQPGVSAEYLLKLKWKELTPAAMSSVRIVRSRLKDFTQTRIHDPRPVEIFEGPVLVMGKSPSAKDKRIRVGVTDKSTIYNEIYYGYSVKGHPHGQTLARYLALVLGSRLALWWSLVTCGEFGVERDVVQKTTVGKMPVVTLDTLDPARRNQIDELFDSLANDNSKQTWDRVDAWVASLYGLSPEDLEVINDTLAYNLPFRHCVADAQTEPKEVDTFRKTLVAELRLWTDPGYEDVLVEPVDLPPGAPWIMMRIAGVGSTQRSGAGKAPSDAWQPVLQLADLLGVAEMVWPDEPGKGLWIARLAQARYWSSSQARLVARRIIWNHLDALFGRPE